MNRRNLLKSLVAGPAAVAVAKAGGEISVTDASQKALEEFRKNSKTLGAPMPNYLDERTHALYDCIHVDRGEMMPEKWPLFCDPIGSVKPGSFDFKTYLHTNMVRGGCLPAPQEMLVNRFLFLLSPGMAERDIVRLSTSSFWEFQLVQKIIARSPLLRAADESKPEEWLDNFGRYTVATRSSRIGEEIGVALVKPIHILPEMYFGMGLYSEPFKTEGDVDIYVLADGVGRFPVQ